MKRKIDSESLPLKNWKKEAAMFQDDYTAGAGTSWLLNVAKAENKMIWEMIRAIEEAPTLTPPNEPLTLEHLRASPHGKIKDSTLQSICNRANEIACRPPEGEEDEA